MTETIMQCCYTNAVQEIGGKISSGWQPVAVTNNIPSEAYNGCVKLQNANSTIQSHMVDERGNVLNLLEITGDGAYVYVSRTQYGLLDRLGRPNMFSHAYIFSWKQEEIICDPNVILTLDKSNFVDNEEAAENVKTSLARKEPFTLQRALQIAGMDAKAYLTLIRCVYSQYSERKTAKPIYVYYDGTEDQMQAILYCIYFGIPHYMRRNLSVASAMSNTSDSKNIIFSEYATKHETYVVPQTGENNILTPRTERKIARYGFVDYAARNFTFIDINAYFMQLEKLALELGDPTASNELILKIAHQMVEGVELTTLNEEELDSRLSDALRSKSYGSQRMEDYISEMLDEIRNRKIFLTEESEANLADRLISPVTSRLADAGEQYNIYRFSTLSVEEAAKMLTHMAKSIFERYSQTLAKSKKGLQILDHYYAEYALSGQEVTWDVLNALLDETSFMSSRLKTTDTIDAKAWELYNSLVEIKGEAIPAYNALMDLMVKLYGAGTRYQYEQAAREAYWEHKSFKAFSYSELDEYKSMSVSSVKCNMFACLYAVLDMYKLNGDDEFLATLNEFFVKFRNVIVEGKLSTIILNKIEEEARAISSKASSLSDWMKVAAVADAKELFIEILKVKKALQMRDYRSFIKTYQKIVEVSSFSRNASTLMKTLSKTLISDCSHADCNQEPIPLDLWLILGASQYSNSFHLFDVLTPRPYILEVNETFVVLQSKLLGRRPYSLYAEDYIQNRGAEAKIVRKWLNELKMAEKRRRADERKSRNEAEGSFLDRGFSFISQFTGGEESSAGRYAANAPKRGNVNPEQDGAQKGFSEHYGTNGTVRPTGDYGHTSVVHGSNSIHINHTGSTQNKSETVPVEQRGYAQKGTLPTQDGYPKTEAPHEQRGFAQPDVPSGNRTRAEDKSSGKKGFFKDLFGRK